jgi:serine/threonine-protein kinase
MPSVENELYAFDEFRLDAAERRLLYRDVTVALPEKAFETLWVLVRNANHLVTRETLLREVWKDTIVEENNLAKNVSLLRRVLRSQADGRDFIETVRGHGFRLTADVRVLPPRETERGERGAAVAALPRGPVRTNRGWPIGLAFAALLGTVLTLSYAAISRKPAAAPMASVAVLPFQAEARLTYLSDGLSEGVLDLLAAFPQLKVSPRSVSFRYRENDINIPEAARELGVEGIITGRVVPRGDELSITVELTDARSRGPVWGHTYSLSARDVLGVLDVQRDITRAVAGTLRLAAEQTRRKSREYTPTPAAFEALLRGRFERQKGSPSGHQSAIGYFTRATAADPNYGLAFAELSLSYSIGIGVPDPRAAMVQAEAAAERALQIDDGLAEAHHALGNVKLNHLDWVGAADQFIRAIELDPRLARAHAGYANVLSVLGRHEQAVAESQKARDLDPLVPRADMQLGWALMLAGQVDRAIELFMKSDFHRHDNLAAAYAAKHMYRESVAEFEQSLAIEGSSPSRQIYLGAAYAKTGEVQKARAILRKLEAIPDYVSPVERAVLLDALGDRDEAFRALDQAVIERDAQLQSLKLEIFFDDIRKDPRFAELLRRVGLPQ